MTTHTPDGQSREPLCVCQPAADSTISFSPLYLWLSDETHNIRWSICRGVHTHEEKYTHLLVADSESRWSQYPKKHLSLTLISCLWNIAPSKNRNSLLGGARGKLPPPPTRGLCIMSATYHERHALSPPRTLVTSVLWTWLSKQCDDCLYMSATRGRLSHGVVGAYGTTVPCSGACDPLWMWRVRTIWYRFMLTQLGQSIKLGDRMMWCRVLDS